MMKTRCAFCEEYKKQVGIGEMEKERGYKMYLRACLYVRSSAGNKEHYSTYSKAMRLRYCPSCGKELPKC